MGEDGFEREDVDAGFGMEVDGHESIEGFVLFGVFLRGPLKPVLVGFVSELVDGVGAVRGVLVARVREECGKVSEERELADKAEGDGSLGALLKG